MLELVQAKLAGLKLRYLLMGERLTLIKSVLNSIPIYQVLVNVLPKRVKKKLHGLFSSFLWGGLGDKRMLHLVNWDTVTAPVYHGDLSILDLEDMNKVLTAK